MKLHLFPREGADGERCKLCGEVLDSVPRTDRYTVQAYDVAVGPLVRRKLTVDLEWCNEQALDVIEVMSS